MKGYKFKLEALLKLRKLKEDQCKMQIGQLRVRIAQLEAQIVEHKSGIGEAYLSQEDALKGGLAGQELRFHPYFVDGKRAHITKIENEISRLDKIVNEKYDDLKKLRGDVKVMEDMKDKDKTKYKKDFEKKEFEEIEEQNQNWRIAVK